MSPPTPPIHPSTRLPRLPLPATRIILFLALINLLLWALTAAAILRHHPTLTSTALLAYTLGLRHALDADHIAAIDLMTRRLIASERYRPRPNRPGPAPAATEPAHGPVTVGTWFSLGHSTIVVITCLVAAATGGALEHRFGDFERIGSIVGTGVSAGVLILLGAANLVILISLVRKLRALRFAPNGPDHTDPGPRAEAQRSAEPTAGKGEREFATGIGGGIMVRACRRVLVGVDRPWKMFPVGVLFGLGFDTSSEVALLGIAGVRGGEGTASLWLIMIFPVLFTAGMCLVDTVDGALMMTLYTSTALARDMVAILYYSIALTAVTILVATCIGTIQLLTLTSHIAQPTGPFWDGVAAAGDHFDLIGGAICGAFALCGLASVVAYGPWRRRFDRRRRSLDSTPASPERLRCEDDGGVLGRGGAGEIVEGADDVEAGKLGKLPEVETGAEEDARLA